MNYECPACDRRMNHAADIMCPGCYSRVSPRAKAELTVTWHRLNHGNMADAYSDYRQAVASAVAEAAASRRPRTT